MTTTTAASPELPDPGHLEALARDLSDIRDQIMQDRVVSVVDVEDLIDRLALARRAQPEGEAPQADWMRDAMRHRYTRATTTAVRDPESGERIEVTPEMYDAAIDAAMLHDPDALKGIKAHDIPPDIAARLRNHDDERLYREADVLMSEAAAEIERLQAIAAQSQGAHADVGQLTKERDGWKEEAEHQKMRCEAAYRSVEMLRDHERADFWIWQGDNTDYLSSMASSKVVLIRADQLRAALAAKAEAPTHETIVQEAGQLVCTACGTSTPGTPEAPTDLNAQRWLWVQENIRDGYELPGGFYLPDHDTSTWDRTVDAARAAQLDGGQGEEGGHECRRAI